MTTPGEHRLERRLAAILAADVAGYSQRMGADDKAVGFTVPVSLLAPADEVIEGGSSSGHGTATSRGATVYKNSADWL